MAKISKYNLVVGGVNFEKGKAYDDEVVKDLDQTNFEDAPAEAPTVAPKVGVIGQDESVDADIPKPDLDSEEVTLPETPKPVENVPAPVIESGTDATAKA
jgi:hypothetical protein